MVIAIVLGACIGAVGFLPLIWGMNLARKATPTSNIGHAGGLLLGLLISFVVIMAAAIACIALFRDYTFPFVLAEAIALCVAAGVYGFMRLVRK